MVAPFTKEDKAVIDKTLHDIEDIKKDIARAKLAKIDVSEQEAKIIAAEEKLRAIKQAYFPTSR
jgi:hypothetical protein